VTPVTACPEKQRPVLLRLLGFVSLAERANGSTPSLSRLSGPRALVLQSVVIGWSCRKAGDRSERRRSMPSHKKDYMRIDALRRALTGATFMAPGYCLAKHISGRYRIALE